MEWEERDMEIQLIGSKALTVFLSGDELARRRLEPQSITAEEAADILKTALEAAGKKGWENVTLEVFPGRDSILLFAHLCFEKTAFFVFDDFETLIEAGKLCPPGIDSVITYIDESYVLSVYSEDGEFPAHLCEYGTKLARPSKYALFLSEHGKKIAGPDGIDSIKKFF
jgi:hypothetical protein